MIGTHQPLFSLKFNEKKSLVGIKCVRLCYAAVTAAILFHGVCFEEG
jgi:hypothetical protein